MEQYVIKIRGTAFKYIKVGFRVTEAERDRLLAYCEKMNLTQAQVFKEALELLYKTRR